MARWPHIFVAVSALLASIINCQSIEPSAPGQTPTVGAELLPGNSSSSQLASLTSLTIRAQVFSDRIPGDLAITTTDNANNFTNANIAYISCDGSDYPGNIKGFETIELVREKGAAAAILYSQQAETCHILMPGDLAGFPIFSMIGSQNATNLLNTVRNETADPAHAFMVMIASTAPRRDDDQPGGRSPSTAVAMIILYSITGVITALFLVIILTGAIRAHRHPERYGPRTESGRPRQGRAAGIARAMLDTIPIVKFGGNDNDNTPPKSTDVELGNTNDASRTSDSPPAPLPTDTMTHPVAVTGRPSVEEANGIAPASASATEREAAANPVGLECSICMNQFEKGEDVRVLPCDHKYHPACIDPWLLNSSGTCPLCRTDLRRKSTNEEEDGSGSNGQASELPPPLEEDPLVMGYTQNNRRSLRAHPSTQEERMAEARRLRESEGTQRSDAANAGDASNDSRRRRLTLRLRERFGIRTHQAESM